MCGVEGVSEVVRDVVDGALGGVWDLAVSRILFAAVVVWSGDVVCGFSWGTVLSKSSARSSFEKVRFASSAIEKVSECGLERTYTAASSLLFWK